MKAVVCYSEGSSYRLETADVPIPEISDNQVRIKVLYCSLNYPDLLIAQGRYQVTVNRPYIPGCESLGIITDLGQSVKNLKLGDKILHIGTHGGMADYQVLESSDVIVIEEDIPDLQVCALLYTYGTAYHALKDRAHIRAGESLVVLGASGGIGTASIEIGKLLGAKVLAVTSSPDKLEYCKKIGADSAILVSEDLKNDIKSWTNGKGADVIVDVLGAQYTEQAYRATAWQGRHLVVGFVAGQIPKIPTNISLLKGSSVVGVFYGRFRKEAPESYLSNVRQLLQWGSEDRINKHVPMIYGFADAELAFDNFISKSISGKQIIKIQEER